MNKLLRNLVICVIASSVFSCVFLKSSSLHKPDHQHRTWERIQTTQRERFLRLLLWPHSLAAWWTLFPAKSLNMMLWTLKLVHQVNSNHWRFNGLIFVLGRRSVVARRGGVADKGRPRPCASYVARGIRALCICKMRLKVSTDIVLKCSPITMLMAEANEVLLFFHITQLGFIAYFHYLLKWLCFILLPLVLSSFFRQYNTSFFSHFGCWKEESSFG